MSVENRKRMYDELVEKKRFADIPQNLLDEFGTPKNGDPKPEQKEPESVKVEKKRGRR